MMKKHLLSLMFTFCVVALGFAQNITIKGTVTDEEKASVIGATVVVDGTQHGTMTGVNGEFELSVPKNATIVVTYIGMESQSIPVNGKTYRYRRLDHPTK